MKDLQTIYEKAFGKKVSAKYLAHKQDTSAFGPSYVGYLAVGENGEPAAFYGVFPCMINYNGQRYVVAQSGDTMTHPSHQGKGLFTALAKKTYELCRELGIHLVFGFPNQNSYPGFVRKLEWQHVNDLHAYVVRVKTVPWVRLKRIFRLPSSMHVAWCRMILSFCRKGSPFDNSVVETDKGGIDRSADFFAYKTYEESRVLNLCGVDVWIKVNDDFLLIGDMARCNKPTFTKVISKLKLLAGMMGLHHLRYHCTQGAYFQSFFAEIGREMETTYPVGGICFTQAIPLNHLHFTMADNDGF